MSVVIPKDIDNDIILSQFTLANILDDVYWLDSKANIIRVNNSACQTSGYTKSELESMTIFDLNPTETKTGWAKHWKQLKRDKKVTLQTRHKHKNGLIYEVEVTNNFIEIDGKEYSCSVSKDIIRKLKAQDLLLVISEATSSYVGFDFFRELTKFITVTLNVKYAFITECANEAKTRVRTISYVDNSIPLENVEYDLAGTPCEIVMTGKDYFQPTELAKIFPREKQMESYLAVPIYSPSTGEVLGHIAALDDKPMDQSKNQISILKIFAARAGSEIERIRSEKN